jgi:hypothetical protein
MGRLLGESVELLGDLHLFDEVLPFLLQPGPLVSILMLAVAGGIYLARHRRRPQQPDNLADEVAELLATPQHFVPDWRRLRLELAGVAMALVAVSAFLVWRDDGSAALMLLLGSIVVPATAIWFAATMWRRGGLQTLSINADGLETSSRRATRAFRWNEVKAFKKVDGTFDALEVSTGNGREKQFRIELMGHKSDVGTQLEKLLRHYTQLQARDNERLAEANPISDKPSRDRSVRASD